MVMVQVNSSPGGPSGPRVLHVGAYDKQGQHSAKINKGPKMYTATLTGGPSGTVVHVGKFAFVGVMMQTPEVPVSMIRETENGMG